MFDDLTIDITFIEYNCSVLPLISSSSPEQISILDTFLKNNAVEVLNASNNSILIYTKLYSREEMESINAINFHPGYTIRSFFLSFKPLIKFIDKYSYYQIKPFLSEDENIDDLF